MPNQAIDRNKNECNTFFCKEKIYNIQDWRNKARQIRKQLPGNAFDKDPDYLKLTHCKGVLEEDGFKNKYQCDLNENDDPQVKKIKCDKYYCKNKMYDEADVNRFGSRRGKYENVSDEEWNKFYPMYDYCYDTYNQFNYSPGKAYIPSENYCNQNVKMTSPDKKSSSSPDKKSSSSNHSIKAINWKSASSPRVKTPSPIIKTPSPRARAKNKRCPPGSRRNKKTGNCDKHNKSAKANTPSPKAKTPSPKQSSPPLANKNKRCPPGSRRNKKTGNCDKHNKSEKANTPSPKPKQASPPPANKNKRCPAGSRRNKKTGNCDKYK